MVQLALLALFYLACILVFFLVLFYIYAPFKMRKSHPIPFTNYKPLASLDDAHIFPEGRDFIARSTQSFIDQGFTLLAYLRNDLPQAGYSQGYSCVAILVDDSRARFVQVVFVFTLRQADTPVIHKVTGIILETSYADGFVLQSATLAENGVFVGRPDVFAVSFHGFVSEPEPLLRVHAVLEKERGHGALRPNEASTDAKIHMDRLSEEVMTLQVQHRYLTRDDAARVFRKTLYGSYRMTWKLLPLSRQWRRIKARRKARHWLAKAQANQNP